MILYEIFSRESDFRDSVVRPFVCITLIKSGINHAFFKNYNSSISQALKIKGFYFATSKHDTLVCIRGESGEHL